jgi:acetolactate decarboxylase
MMKLLKYIPVVSLLLIQSIIAPAYAGKHDSIIQFSTLSSLLAGVYDGTFTLNRLKENGDFGLGTFDGLDGEMVMLDGHVYKVRYSGKVVEPPLSETTPFAVVTCFDADKHFVLASGLDYDGLKRKFEIELPNNNVFYAIKIKGTFSMLKVRSVHKQKRPYPPLKQAVKGQAVFDMRNVEGTIVGFVSPPFIGKINVPGYHLHFIDSARKAGGHVLSFQIKEAEMDVDMIYDFHLYLSPDNNFHDRASAASADVDVQFVEHGYR